MLKSLVYPLEWSVFVLEVLIRVVILCCFLVTKYLTPHAIEVSSPAEYLEYGYPVTENPIVSALDLYKLVAVYSALAVTLGLVYARLALRADGRALMSSVVYYVLAASLALILTALATNVLKIVAGRMRPDFVARCLPSEFHRDRVPHFEIYDATGHLREQFSHAVLRCELNTPFDVLDGRKSFPSGHSSYTAAVAGVAAVYFLRLLRARGGARSSSPATAALCILVLLGCVLFPLLVGLSRVIDRRHHPSDVFAGLGLGAVHGVITAQMYFDEPFAIPGVTPHSVVVGAGEKPCCLNPSFLQA